jgi:uncharacterized protein YcbK (DUF882 family)
VIAGLTLSKPVHSCHNSQSGSVTLSCEQRVVPGVLILTANRHPSYGPCALVLLVGILCLPAGEAAIASPQREYRLRLYHTHTNEQIDLVYRRGNVYIPDAIDRLDRFLRDHRTGAIYRFDPRLFDLLHELTTLIGRPESEIDIVCGYRSPWSNEFLRHTTSGVASHSLHMQGKAIDIRIPGIPTSELRDLALRLHAGGVGYYPKSEFVHVDIGRIRRW